MYKRILKLTANYIIWFFVTVSIGIIGIWLNIGAPVKKDTGSFLSKLNDVIVHFVVFYIGFIRGVLGFLIFLFFDIKYLRHHNTNSKRTLLRILAILLITIGVTIIHDILEYKLDWI